MTSNSDQRIVYHHDIELFDKYWDAAAKKS